VLMSPVIAWLAVIFWLGVIWFFGRAGFGRANTQRLIDLLKHYRRLWEFLDKHHGKFRAAFHYIEFGACYAVLYAAVSGGFAWHYGKGAAVWGATCGLAYLDELHQKRSGGRCFRRVDLLHSVLGASLIMLFIFLREFF